MEFEINPVNHMLIEVGLPPCSEIGVEPGSDPDIAHDFYKRVRDECLSEGWWFNTVPRWEPEWDSETGHIADNFPDTILRLESLNRDQQVYFGTEAFEPGRVDMPMGNLTYERQPIFRVILRLPDFRIDSPVKEYIWAKATARFATTLGIDPRIHLEEAHRHYRSAKAINARRKKRNALNDNFSMRDIWER